MTVDRLIDSNVLVYRFDPRDPLKQQIASEALRAGLEDGTAVLSHQALIEFVAAVSRQRRNPTDGPILDKAQALIEAESLARQFPVLYPDAEVLGTALRGCMMYQLPWFDAHLWAYAERFGIPEIVSEDFAHGRHYGSVRVVNPFLVASGSVQELPALYQS